MRLLTWLLSLLVDTRPTCGNPMCLDRSKCEDCQDAEAW